MAILAMPTRAGRAILPQRAEKFPTATLVPRLSAIAALTCLVLSIAAPAAAQSSYAVEDLGTLPGDFSSIAWGINANGDVVGWSNGPNGTRAFVYTNLTKMVGLPGLPNGPRSLARDINDAGDIVGNANAGGTDLGHAVLWRNGIAQDLGTLGGASSEAWGINNIGQAVGTASTADGKGHGFLYVPGQGLRDLTPNSDQGAATDVNDAGQVTGYKTALGGYHAFRWVNGAFLDLGVLPDFAHSFGWAINAAGEVAGSSTTASGNSERFIRFSDGSGLENLGGTGEHNTAWGINASGLVVGCRGQSGKRAVRFTDEHGLQELNALIDPSLGWLLLCAHDVNDAGQIVGYAFNNLTGVTHAVRLQPLTAPPPECTVNCLRSTNIVLRDRAKGLKGVVTVRNENGVAVGNALVVARWTNPDGTTADVNGWTDSTGRARFLTAHDQAGTYTFRVVNIVLSLYTFNPSKSVLTKSITIAP